MTKMKRTLASGEIPHFFSFIFCNIFIKTIFKVLCQLTPMCGSLKIWVYCISFQLLNIMNILSSVEYFAYIFHLMYVKWYQGVEFRSGCTCIFCFVRYYQVVFAIAAIYASCLTCLTILAIFWHFPIHYGGWIVVASCDFYIHFCDENNVGQVSVCLLVISKPS